MSGPNLLREYTMTLSPLRLEALVYDRVLNWVSEKGSGNLEEFKKAWDWVRASSGYGEWRSASKPWHGLSDLSALGHAEISWGGGNPWAVARPALTMLPNSGCRAVLVGARTKALFTGGQDDLGSGSGVLNRIYDEQQIGFDIDVIEPADCGRKGPTSIVIAGESIQEVQKVASAAGVDFTFSISRELAAMFPTLERSRALWVERSMPQGHPLKQFDPDRMRWIDCPERDNYPPGLYRAEASWDVIHILELPGGRSVEVSREHGVYELLRWEEISALQYSMERRELWVPVQARLPLLQARAATLATGILPKYEKRNEQDGQAYVNVDEFLADRIAKSLDQKVKFID